MNLILNVPSANTPIRVARARSVWVEHQRRCANMHGCSHVRADVSILFLDSQKPRLHGRADIWRRKSVRSVDVTVWCAADFAAVSGCESEHTHITTGTFAAL